MEKKIIYYHDELNDEFSTAKITPKIIDGNFKYYHKNLFWKIAHFICYRLIATPIAILYPKFKYHIRYVNKKALKSGKKNGYFLFGNHTSEIGDPFIPNAMIFPKTAYVIVHPNNISMPFLGALTPFLGALPIPGDLKSSRNFMDAIKKHLKNKACIVVYPEAHIWPYYTHIRPFPNTSFAYPIKFDVPSFCFTNTYQKRKHSNKVKMVTYIDGPFYPNKELSLNEQKHDLRNRIYEVMTQRSQNNTVEVIQYIKKEESHG